MRKLHTCLHRAYRIYVTCIIAMQVGLISRIPMNKYMFSKIYYNVKIYFIDVLYLQMYKRNKMVRLGSMVRLKGDQRWFDDASGKCKRLSIKLYLQIYI